MRFFANGPSIPDALLDRCDQGRVVFLCGAGVSLPSGMPDFVGLVRHVVKFFDPPADSPITRAFGPRTDEDYRPSDDDGPLVPLDQIFHLLHQEYGRQDVNSLVAECLATEHLSGPSHEHKLIARISSDPESRPQIVTTNFDRLFDQCPGVTGDRIFAPPAFPDIELGMPIFGVSYLHGRIQAPEYPNHDYILSSADFGRAYLAEGWATKFVRALLDQYTVVLLGYQAEDPPVKYLLQGLNHDGRRDTANLYAFDRGELEDIEVKWRDRGVTPIPYAEHDALWATLEAWANRADDPRTWRKNVVEMAKRGPRELSPHERGQVAHLVRTTPGARLFAQSDPSPPAEWLNVFDASCRVAKKSRRYEDNAAEFDSLEVYGLDDDPDRPPEMGGRSRRAHDHLLEWRRGDTNPATSHSLAGRLPEGSEDMAPRLFHLMNWSAKLLNTPLTAWWAARQHSLHPRHTKEIERQLQSTDDLHPEARRTWTLILESLSDKRAAAWDGGWFDFVDRIEKDGWTNGVRRAFDEAMAPILACKPPYGVGESKPPEGSWDAVSLRDIARWEIKFPEQHGNGLDVPDKALPEVFLIAERHLKRASSLYQDIGTDYVTTPTCYPGRDLNGEEEDHDEVAYFRWFLASMNRLSDLQPEILRSQVMAWDHQEQFFFRKLKLFALNDSRLFEANTAVGIALEFSQDALWDYDIRSEFLFLIADRWSDLSAKTRIALVNRLLAGPGKMEHWSPEEYAVIRVELPAQYLRWLELQGCELTSDQSSRLAAMINSIEGWTDDWATSIVVQHGRQIHSIVTDTDPGSLVNVPVGEVLDRARTESTRDYRSHTDFKPFNGLVKSAPRKALAALSHASRKGQYPVEFWRPFIQNRPKELSPRLNTVFLHRVARLPHETMRELSHPLADWIRENFQSLYDNDTELAWYTFDAIATGLVSDDGSAINSGRGETRINGNIVEKSRRTYGHAINGPLGQLAEGLLNALNGMKLEKNAGLPEEFKSRIERLLTAPGEGRDHIVAILARQLSWLHYLDRDWIMTRVMPWFEFDDPASEPTWNAFLTAAKLPQDELGQQLKPMLLNIFPRIYQWSWGHELAKIATQMVIELAIYKASEPDGLTSGEARNCIRKMSDSNRQDAIFRLGQIGQRADGGWSSHVGQFIESTWPRERKFRTTGMVSAWIKLLDDTGDEFPQMLNSVRRFLVPVEHGSHWLYKFTREVGGQEPLTKKHPSAVLDMLDAIIPNDPQAAPFELSSILDLIEAADPRLARDRRYFRLIDLVERG